MFYAPKAFSIATPLRRERRASLILRFALRLARKYRDYAPLAALGTLHMAGFGILRTLRNRHGEPVPIADGRQFLLFVSLFDGSAEQYLADFGTLVPDQIDQIWGHCLRYPGARAGAAFVEWLDSHQFDEGKEGVAAYAFDGYTVDANGRSVASSEPNAAPAMLPLITRALEIAKALRRLRDDGNSRDGDGLATAVYGIAGNGLRTKQPPLGAQT